MVHNCQQLPAGKLVGFRHLMFALHCIALPVEVHILSGSGAIAIEAHAVQLALQTGFGLALGAVP